MKGPLDRSAPVVIGGLGGSGTRVVAQIFIELGFYLGDDLNAAYDNLLATALFKRPHWFQRAMVGNGDRIFSYLNILTTAMLGTGRPAINALGYILRANWDRIHTRYEKNGIGPIVRSIFGTWKSIFLSRQSLDDYIGWGWKEPNTHIYLAPLFQYYKKIKYIHVVRNGLDMAYSRNQQQVNNWGWLYGLDRKMLSRSIPQASLKFWIQANRTAITLGKQAGRDRFFLVNFEKLCTSPEAVINGMMAFTNVDAEPETRSSLYRLPRLPKTSGRYKAHDLGEFDREDINAVRQMGFAVDTR